MTFWDPYLDLESGVLRNRLGITDRAELTRAEAELTSYRLIELRERPLPGDYDLAHLQAFHRHLLGDLYDWAGEIRTVRLGRGRLFCPPEDIPAVASGIFGRLAAADRLRGRSRDALLDGLTRLLAELNALHPFREGNGRTQRAFCSQLAADAGYELCWTTMDPRQNVAASIAAHGGDLRPLRALLCRLLAP